MGLAVMLLVAARAAAAAPAESPIELRRGTVTTTIDGATHQAPVELSYHWDRRHAGRPGLADFELPFTLAAEPATPWGIFLPRAGNVLEVRLNDALLQAWGVKVLPTVLFFGKGGVEVAPRLVGASIPDFYGAYLDERLRVARAAVR